MAEGGTWPDADLVKRGAEWDWFVLGDVEGQPMGGAVLGRRLITKGRGLLIEVRLGTGATVPPHTHEHDSYCYLLSGKVELRIGGLVAVVEAGDAFFHPDGVPHEAHAIEDSHWIELKTPAQETWTST